PVIMVMVAMIVMVMPVAMMVVAMVVPMPMPVIIIVTMIVAMIIVIVRMHRRPFEPVFAAERLVAAGAVAIALARTVLRSAADALDVVVMAFLRGADLGLEADHLLAIFAHL